MEMEPEQLKRLFAVFVNNLKRLETELVAHRIVFLLVSQMNAIPDLDQALLAAKQKAAVGMDQKYNDILETFLHIAAQAGSDQEVVEFLKSWNPEGPVN
jgi:hypothetical protein